MESIPLAVLDCTSADITVGTRKPDLKFVGQSVKSYVVW